MRSTTDAPAGRRRLVAGAVAWLLAAPALADLRATIAGARPSVVPVGTYRATDSPRFGFRGSGFVVGDGTWVVTNFHVLPQGPEADSGPSMAVLGLTAAPGREAADLRLARVMATDRVHDLVLLRIERPALPALALAEPGSAYEGQAVVLMGFPIGGALGFAPVTHRGIVASITTAALPAPSAAQLDPRAVARLRQGNFEVLQLDATAYPGNSGGPLIDAASGQVIGVVNMVLVKGSRETALSAPTGITYAIPVRYVHALLEEARREPVPAPTQTR